MLKRLANSSILNLISGIILLITAGWETWESIEEASLGAHHGVLIFGIIQILKSLPDILEATKDIHEAKN